MQTTAIDMLTPAQTRTKLHVDDAALISLVNDGRLPAYNLGEGIRFRALDVAALDRQLVAA